MTPDEMRQIFNIAGEAGDPFITKKHSTRQLEALVRAAYEDAAKVAEEYDAHQGWGDVDVIAAAIREKGKGSA